MTAARATAATAATISTVVATTSTSQASAYVDGSSDVDWINISIGGKHAQGSSVTVRKRAWDEAQGQGD